MIRAIVLGWVALSMASYSAYWWILLQNVRRLREQGDPRAQTYVFDRRIVSPRGLVGFLIGGPILLAVLGYGEWLLRRAERRVSEARATFLRESVVQHPVRCARCGKGAPVVIPMTAAVPVRFFCTPYCAEDALGTLDDTLRAAEYDRMMAFTRRWRVPIDQEEQ